MATWGKRAIIVGLGAAFLLFLGGMSAESQLISPCKPTYPDEVSDLSNCASPLEVRNADELDWPTDVDWYTAYSPVDVGLLARFTVSPSLGAIRCTVFSKSPAGLVQVADYSPAPGTPCQISFVPYAEDTYYLRISVAGPYLSGMKSQPLSVSIDWNSCYNIISPDEVGDRQSCASPLVERNHDTLSGPTDLDWYSVDSSCSTCAGTGSVFSVSPSMFSYIRCSAYYGHTFVAGNVAKPGEQCLIRFVSQPYHTYHLRVSAYKYDVRSKYEDLQVAVTW